MLFLCFSQEMQEECSIFIYISIKLWFSFSEIGKFRFCLNIYKSSRNISLNRLSSYYICPSASIWVFISEINRTVEELFMNAHNVFQGSRWNESFLQILSLISRSNKRYIRVSHTKCSGNTLFLLEYLINYDFHSCRSDNFDIFCMLSNLACLYRVRRCHPITFAFLHVYLGNYFWNESDGWRIILHYR